MKRAVLLSLFALLVGASCTDATAAPTRGIKKICPDGTTVPYKKACPPDGGGDPAPSPTATIAVQDVTVNENAGTVTITVLKTNAVTASWGYSYATSNGTAAAGSDYTTTTGSKTEDYNHNTSTFTVPILNNLVQESTESFTVTISSPTANVTISDPTATVTITDDDVAPPTIPPPSGTPGGSDEPAESLEGYTYRTVTDFTYTDALQTTEYNTRDAGIDPLGAFREICSANVLKYDDFILSFGSAGASHLHDFNGHEGVNANSTFSTLLASGGSMCNWQLSPNNTKAVQRSSYWIPAFLDGNGNVLRPDYISLYYKRLPKTNPKCGTPTGTGYGPVGICTEIPNGLKSIAGMNPATGVMGPTNIRTDWARPNTFMCQNDGRRYNDLVQFAAGSPSCTTMELDVAMPMCWDGQYLWKNNRDHLRYMKNYNTDGVIRCEPTHPYYITEVTLHYVFNVTGLDKSKLKLSSDDMDTSKPRGWSLHADMIIVWDARVKKMFHDNCIERHLNCDGGDLGNGYRLKGAAQPPYGWANPNRLTPVP